MKITDPDVIKNGEKDLIEAVTDDLDLDAVQDILKKRMAAAALSSKGGQIIVHNNEIAFRLDFDIQLSGSLMFDRQGNYIPESSETDDGKADEPEAEKDDLIQDDNIEDDIVEENIVDEDLSDILEESREFWEPEKE